MPPRRSARVAAVVERATTALSPLPLSVVLHIFNLLPVDVRLRCAEVCRGWRAVLTERSLWTRLDLLCASGVRLPLRWPYPLDALLRCAAARAGGSLQSLQVDKNLVTRATLLDVAAANAGTLQELCAYDVESVDPGLSAAQVEALLGVALLLRTFATDLSCDNTDAEVARRALRNEAPFGPLRVRMLTAVLRNADEASFVPFAAGVAAHTSLLGLTLYYAPLNTPAALDAVVDAALAQRMHTLALEFCLVSPATAPALARLLSGHALSKLRCVGVNLVDAPAARVLAAALRANSTLTSLALHNAGVFRDAVAGAELLGALNGHASLRELSMRDNLLGVAGGAVVVGAALGALVAVNAPALSVLDVSACDLRDDGLRALFEALPRNTHLRMLTCYANDMSEAFGRDVLLPAVCANVSLRALDVGHEWAVARQAMQLVQCREGRRRAHAAGSW
jgi:hypothetical protein